MNHHAGKKLLQKFQEGDEHKGFTFIDGVSYFQQCLFVPLESALCFQLLQDCHATLAGGHSSVKGMLICLAASFSWPHMCRDVKEYVQTCEICQKHKSPNHK